MKYARLLVAAVAFAFVTACNSNSTTSSVPAPTATPTAVPTAAAVILPAGSAPVSSALGTMNGTSATIALPAANATATVTAQLTSAPPPSVPALSSAKRTTTAIGTTALAYVTLSASAPITFASTPTFTFTLPSGPAATYALAYYDPTQSALGYQPVYTGPGAVNGNTITFVGTAKTVVFAANSPAVFALYAASAATATASPTAAVSGQVAGSPISHVIVVVQENRTFDNLFGLSGLTGGTTAYPGADAVNKVGTTSMRVGSFTEPYDPSHSHASLVAEWDNGKMDGFATDPVSSSLGTATPPPGYTFMNVAPSETLAYHLLASRYALADRMFSSRLVPSFPGHQFLIAGQGPADNPTDNAIWGCDSKAGSTALQFSTGENVTSPGAAPCYDYQTLGDLLDAKGVSWKYYTGAIASLDGLNSAYDAIKHIRNGPDWTRNIVSPVTAILDDVQACTLPAVSYVTPPSLASDHAGSFTAAGPGWVASIYLAIAQSAALTNPACQYYTNTAILVTWDDAGGWYDHVVPPVDAQGNSWGFRVPLIVASAFAKSGYSATNANSVPYTSHTPREFGSILRYIEKNWGLGSLGTRDSNADDLSDMFSYGGTPIPPIGATIQAAARYPASYYRNLQPPSRPVDDDK